MNNTMISIGEYIKANLAAFGLTTADELQLVEKSKIPLPNGAKRLILKQLPNLPDSRGEAFGNLWAGNQTKERFETQIEIELKHRAGDMDQDFLWNKPRAHRDTVYATLAGPTRAGLKIPRYDYTNPDAPVVAGEIWFVVDKERPSPIEDPIEDPNEPANKSIFMTWVVRWEKPF